MAIPFQCHQCGGQFAAPDQLAGKKAKCQRCGAVVQVPHAAAAPAFAPAAAAPQADMWQSAGAQAANPLANPLAPLSAPSYPQQGGAYLPPGMSPAGGGGMPWGWILGGGAALVVLAGAIGLVVTLSSMLFRPGPNPLPIAANNQPVVNPVVPAVPAQKPAQPAANPPGSESAAAPAQPAPPTNIQPPPSTGSSDQGAENPFDSAETVSLPDRPTGLPKVPAGEGLENPFGEEAPAQQPAAAADLTKAAGWAVRPDPPAIPIEYKQGKISIPFPDSAELRLPNGPSHFVLGTMNDFKADAFQVFDLRNGKAIGKQVMTPREFGRQTEAFSPDGRYLAAIQHTQVESDTTPVIVWSFISGDIHRTLELEGKHVSGQLRFGAAHQLISLHNPDWDNYILTVWDLQTGSKLKEVKLPYGRGETQLRPESLSVSPGGKYACLLIGKQLGAIDLTTGEPAGAITLSEPPSSCEGTMFSPDGAELAMVVSQASGHHLYVFEIATGRVLLDKDYRGRLQHFFYNGPIIDWLPDKSGLVYNGHLLLERNTGEEVWVFPTTDSNPRRLISAGDILVLLRDRSSKVLKTEELPEKDIAKAMQSVKDGGSAVDSALPPLTSADLFSATAAALPNGFVQWSVQPDVGGTPPKGQEREILIAKEGESVQRMLFAAPESGKVVVQKEVTAKGGPGRAQSRQIVIERYDTTSGSKGNTVPLPNVYQLSDVSPSGDFAVVAFARESGKYDRLDIVGLSPRKHICAWRPFGGEQEKKDGDPRRRHFDFGWSNDPKLVVWAAMIDDQHVLTINTAGKLVCWKIPECKAVYYFEDFGEPLALSAGRRFLAGGHFGEFRIFDAHTGQCVGDLEAPALGTRAVRGGFRPDGRELAAVIDAGPDKMLVRWNLADGKLVQEIPIPGETVGWYSPFHFSHNGARAGLEYRGDNFLLLDDQFLFNLDKRAVAWRYHLNNGYYAVNAPDQNTWYGIRKNNANDNSIFLTYMPTPSQSVKNKSSLVTLEQQLVLFPGKSVRLHVDLNGVGMSDLTPSVTKAIQQSLEARGFIVDPSAPLVFSMVAAQRSTGESVGVYQSNSPFGYHSPFFEPRGNASETVDIQEMVCRMAVSNASGKVLWHQDRGNRMRSWGSVNQGGSASQQLRDEMVAGFKGLLASSGSATEAVPRYIFADLDTILAGESQLGFRTEAPPPTVNLPAGQVKKEPGTAPGT